MLALIGLAPLLGKYMAKVFMGEKHFMKPVLGWLEKSVYLVSGIKSEEEMNWKSYMYGVLLFNLFGFVLLFLTNAAGISAAERRKIAQCFVASLF
jgi:K+-transporting ATPase ATPase A chain